MYGLLETESLIKFFVSRMSVFLLMMLVTMAAACEPHTECKAKEHLDHVNRISEEWANKGALAEWAYTSNITEENLKNKVIYKFSF